MSLLSEPVIWNHFGSVVKRDSFQREFKLEQFDLGIVHIERKRAFTQIAFAFAFVHCTSIVRHNSHYLAFTKADSRVI